MKVMFVLCIAAILSLTGCSPSTPLECDAQQVKSKLVDEMKSSLAMKTSAIMRQGISAKDLSINIESTKTIKKDKDNPFYRKCEISFTMPGMIFSSTMIYEIDKDEDGDLVLKFSI